MPENEAITPVGLTSDGLLEMAREAEQRVEAIKKIKILSLRVTNPHDWTDQGGRPYLQVSGAEKVARLFGISWRFDPPMLIVEEDGHFRYEYKGYFSMGAAEIEVVGTRSSRDLFFTGKANPKPPSEIDKGDVMKAAFTNCVGNGVTRLLGIRNLTYEDLQEAGIDPAKIGKVEYKKQEMSTEAQGQREEIRKMLEEMSGGDPKLFAAGLQKYTSFTGKDGQEVKGKTKIEDLSEKAVPVTYGKIKKAYDEWKAKGGAGNGSGSDS